MPELESIFSTDDKGFVIDTKDAEEREEEHRTRGTSRPITVVGNPILHREARDVIAFDDDLAGNVDDLFASMHITQGVGLAASQIGFDAKVFVYDCMDDENVRHVGHIVNPVLEDLPADRRALNRSGEGCASVPTAYAPLERADYAVVRGLDVKGAPIRIQGTGDFARCLQHGTDHVYGRLYIDRLPKDERKDALRQMAEGTPRYPVVPND